MEFQGFEVVIGQFEIHAKKACGTDVFKTWCKLHPQQIKQREDQVGVPIGISCMLLNVDFGVIVEDFIERISGFAVGWWCNECPILRILIGSPR